MTRHLAGHERVGITLERRIPGDDRRVILVGGAAIRWHLAHRELDYSGLPELGDVDVIVNNDYIRPLLRYNPHGELQCSGNKFVVTPTDRELAEGVVTLEAFTTTTDAYSHPLVPKEKNSFLPVSGLLAPWSIERIKGRRVLELPLVLWWKQFVGRPEDIDAVQRVLKILHDQNGASNQERSRTIKLLIAAQYGEPIREDKPDSPLSYLPPYLLRDPE